MASPEMSIITPAALKRGDTIAFVSPSSRPNTLFPLRIERARAFLEAQGFKVKEVFSALPSPAVSNGSAASPAAAAADHTFRSSVAHRASEIHSCFTDPSVQAIVCTIGGLTANELLPHLDYALIRANPKIFIGMSDITVLHHALFAGAGLRTFYGPAAVTQLGDFPTPMEFTWEHFCHVLVAGNAPGGMPRSLAWTEEFLDWAGEPDNLRARTLEHNEHGWRWLRPGQAEGRLWGGCLPSVLQLFGTRWQVSYAGKILLLELPEGVEPGKSRGLEFARWNLADLGLLGVWDKIAGLVLGRPYMYTADQVELWERTVLDITEGYDFPILAGVDCGHTDPLLTVPLDAKCRLNSTGDEWVFDEPAVIKREDD